jgi:hypothetical protein
MSGSKIKRIDAGALKAQLHDGGEFCPAIDLPSLVHC